MTKSVRRCLLMLLAGIALVACSPQANPPAAASSPQPATAAARLPTAAPAPTARPDATPLPGVQPDTTPAPTSTPAPTQTPNPTADPITGAPALARGAVTQRPYIVMIDNHPDAYPQSGLSQAVVVFEALAEYGVTRFMALYVPGITPDVEEIGPVRSTRVYFAQWAMGYNALYAHAGGSPAGLQLVESTDQLVNLDALRRDGSAYFVRSAARFAPHNLYTSSDELARAAARFGVAELHDSELGFLFKADAPLAQRPDSWACSYFFIYREDPAGWTYDRATNGYLRLRRGKPARDAITGKQLWTKNVVVLEVKERPINGDDKGRIEQEVIGSGRARLFADGIERAITWRKDSDASPLRLYMANGDEVLLNAGPVWIVALPSLDNLTVQ